MERKVLEVVEVGQVVVGLLDDAGNVFQSLRCLGIHDGVGYACQLVC